MSDRDLRLISLLPGATEWICELGLQSHLVGVSHECDYPEAIIGLPRVTRSRIDTTGSGAAIDAQVRQFSESQTPLYELDGELVRELEPDLILTQSLCNVCAVRHRDVERCIESLSRPCRLLDLRATTMQQLANDAALIVKATGDRPESVAALRRWNQRLESARQDVPRSGKRATLLEWLDPLFCSGHWTPQLIEWAGGIDPIGRTGQPSRQISPKQLADAQLDLVLVACCGMDASASRVELEAVERTDWWSPAIGQAALHVLDGNAFFNRPGPRLVDALQQVQRCILALA